jgi:MFS family permease
MSLGQVSEIVSMLLLAGLLSSWRLKWILGLGLTFGVFRFALCAVDSRAWLLAGVALHGCSFALVFITAQIYVDERVDRAWRARAQALMSLMTSGVGNLLGYLGTGWWFVACARPDGPLWSRFWGGLAVLVAVALGFFLIAYRGVGTGIRRVKTTEPAE